jgi:hypothetical protein
MRKRASWLADGFLLYFLTAALIWPLFRLKYLDNWASIEGSFISQARFLMEHWPHPRWQPLWYCGTRFDYVYPPALQYGTAILAKLFGLIPARAYHLYTAIFYCAGIVGVYLLIRVGSGSRGAAWLGAAAAALVSPAILLTPKWKIAYPNFAPPQRLGVLVNWGEGPHITAFALLPIALAAGFLGLRKGRPGALALCALFSALVVSNNFYGATALAILFPVLVWAVWLEERDCRVWLRGAAIAALAYGLTAPWLTPSYIRVTLRNMKLVSEPGNQWSLWIALAAAALFAGVTLKLARGRRLQAWPVFVAGALLFIGLNVLGQHYFNFRVLGEPKRHVPELDLVIILAAVEGLRRLWTSKIRFAPVIAAAIALVCLLPARHYIRHAWSMFPRDGNYRTRPETRLPEWVAKNIPEERVLSTGSVRFWYTTWNNLPEIDGASDQGTLNQRVGDVDYVATGDKNIEHCILALASCGADALIVIQKNSQEVYHDYRQPKIYAGALPELYDDHQGNVIYRIPRRSPGLVHLVEAARVRSLHPIQPNTYYEDLRAYLDTFEKGPVLTWDGPDRMRIRAQLAPGQAVVLQESYDPSCTPMPAGSPSASNATPWILC